MKSLVAACFANTGVLGWDVQDGLLAAPRCSSLLLPAPRCCCCCCSSLEILRLLNISAAEMNGALWGPIPHLIAPAQCL